MNVTKAHIGIVKELKNSGRAPGSPSIAEDQYFQKKEAELREAQAKPKMISVRLPEFGDKKYTIVYNGEGNFDHVHDQNKKVVMIILIQHGQDVGVENVDTMVPNSGIVHGVYVRIKDTNIVFPKRLFHLL